MFNQMLVPLDGSTGAEDALPHAVMLAQAFDSKVTLLHVLDAMQLGAPSGSIDPLQWQVDRSEAHAYLDAVASRLRASGLETQVIVREGRAADAIIEQANGSDLVVLSPHGQGGDSRWAMGSVSQKVLSGADCSILLARPGLAGADDRAASRYRRLLVPLDGSMRAEAVLSPAAALAQSCDAQMLIAHVVGSPEMPRRLPLSEDELALAQRLMDTNVRAAVSYLQQIELRLRQGSQTHLLQGSSVTVTLHQLVAQEGIDLVVLCAHGYTGNAHWRYGGVVTSFITYGTTPLLILQDMPALRPPAVHDTVVRNHEIPQHGTD